MPKIDVDAKYQTVITTFECSPGTCADLLEALNSILKASRRRLSLLPSTTRLTSTMPGVTWSVAAIALMRFGKISRSRMITSCKSGTCD